MGSNPVQGKMVFPVGLFFFFLLLLHFLHHGSIQSAVCPVWSFYEEQHRGIMSQPLKKDIEINLSLPEEISMNKS